MWCIRVKSNRLVATNTQYEFVIEGVDEKDIKKKLAQIWDDLGDEIFSDLKRAFDSHNIKSKGGADAEQKRTK